METNLAVKGMLIALKQNQNKSSGLPKKSFGGPLLFKMPDKLRYWRLDIDKNKKTAII